MAFSIFFPLHTNVMSKLESVKLAVLSLSSKNISEKTALVLDDFVPVAFHDADIPTVDIGAYECAPAN
jgi:hypothetical protein